MPSVFTRVINGELPGRFVWRDDRVVAFLPLQLLAPGHVLVVTADEIDHWIDVDPELNAHLMTVAQRIGRALDAAFDPRRVSVMVVGEEVPHCHVHVVPWTELSQLSFANADANPDPADLDDYAERTRAALRDLGFAEFVPDA